MGLYVWDQATDVFKYNQLASNFTAIDAHDHSSGKGVKISKKGLADSVSATIPTYETSLPAGPPDGQEIYYAADATNGVIWHLRYRTSVARWEFVGGVPLSWESTTQYTTSGYTTDTWTQVIGPLINSYILSIPRAGKYRVRFSALLQTANSNTADQTTNIFLGLAKGVSLPAPSGIPKEVLYLISNPESSSKASSIAVNDNTSFSDDFIIGSDTNSGQISLYLKSSQASTSTYAKNISVEFTPIYITG